MNEEESNKIIAEAIRRYPLGTLVNSTGGTLNAKVTSHKFFWDSNQLRASGDCAVYDRRYSKWAMITRAVELVEPIIINHYEIY